ncbi:restriction endonuclease subunit S [Mycoplasmopsis gallinarum]
MEPINTIDWKWFYLIDYFEIKKSKNIVKETAEESIGNDLLYITRTANNNGIVYKCNANEFPNFNLANSITIGGESATVFYQDKNYITGNNITIIYPKKIIKSNFNLYTGLFIVTVLSKESFKYNYGRAFNLKSIKETKIKLPAILNNNGIYEPDWKFMEHYTKTLYKDTIQRHYTKNTEKFINLNIEQWKEFKIRQLFNFEKGKCNNASKLLEDGDDIYYIGAKKNDNGVMRKVKWNQQFVSNKNCLVFIIDGEGSVGFHTYQNNDFIGSTTLMMGYNKNLNKYNAMFLITVLDKNKYKYSYGRKYQINELTKIKLPAKLNSKGKYEPDWEFMEKYIKELPYGDVI